MKQKETILNSMNNKIYYIFIFSFISCNAADTELTTFSTNYKKPQIIHNYFTEAIFSKDRINNPEKYYKSLIALAKYRDLQGTKALHGLLCLAEWYRRHEYLENLQPAISRSHITFPYPYFYDALFSEDLLRIRSLYKHVLTRLPHQSTWELHTAIYQMASLATYVFQDDWQSDGLADDSTYLATAFAIKKL